MKRQFATDKDGRFRWFDIEGAHAKLFEGKTEKIVEKVRKEEMYLTKKAGGSSIHGVNPRIC